MCNLPIDDAIRVAQVLSKRLLNQRKCRIFIRKRCEVLKRKKISEESFENTSQSILDYLDLNNEQR